MMILFACSLLLIRLMVLTRKILLPSGFLGLGPQYQDRGRLEVKAEEWEDSVDVVSRGFMALTVACARCHDHKYDPISTADYMLSQVYLPAQKSINVKL